MTDQDFLLASSTLSEFITGFLHFKGEFESPVQIPMYENSLCIGIPLGKPFDLYLGGNNLEEESIYIESFDKPYVINAQEGIHHIWVSGKISLVIPVFTTKGTDILLQNFVLHPNQNIYPLSRNGLPIFNLLVRKQLRAIQNDQEGLEIVEKEFARFFKKHSCEERVKSGNNNSEDFIFNN
ncbi:hypothetical protein [Cecembia calidifontis]|jgi:hypothetical protein|uniref:AraC family transcriptional regulator n=1 Tax=Cecembia calidifontis TaxID=1187080 RepID=A0A4Q7PBA1_9BACT|nr:hypothetical protein [Cecembia calidifontis]RZS97475.1 hypothetical protein BC751_3082 [Cecembia calidifontis]